MLVHGPSRAHLHRYLREKEKRKKGLPARCISVCIIMIKYFFAHKYIHVRDAENPVARGRPDARYSAINAPALVRVLAARIRRSYMNAPCRCWRRAPFCQWNITKMRLGRTREPQLSPSFYLDAAKMRKMRCVASFYFCAARFKYN